MQPSAEETDPMPCSDTPYPTFTSPRLQPVWRPPTNTSNHHFVVPYPPPPPTNTSNHHFVVPYPPPPPPPTSVNRNPVNRPVLLRRNKRFNRPNSRHAYYHRYLFPLPIKEKKPATSPAVAESLRNIHKMLTTIKEETFVPFRANPIKKVKELDDKFNALQQVVNRLHKMCLEKKAVESCLSDETIKQFKSIHI